MKDGRFGLSDGIRGVVVRAGRRCAVGFPSEGGCGVRAKAGDCCRGGASLDDDCGEQAASGAGNELVVGCGWGVGASKPVAHGRSC